MPFSPPFLHPTPFYPNLFVSVHPTSKVSFPSNPSFFPSPPPPPPPPPLPLLLYSTTPQCPLPIAPRSYLLILHQCFDIILSIPSLVSNTLSPLSLSHFPLNSLSRIIEDRSITVHFPSYRLLFTSIFCSFSLSWVRPSTSPSTLSLPLTFPSVDSNGVSFFSGHLLFLLSLYSFPFFLRPRHSTTICALSGSHQFHRLQ